MTTATTARGAAAIREAFAAAREANRAALVPYVVCGRPSVEAMPELLAALADAGADVIELGVPFSDPLADGPVIRDATRLALDAGVTVATCLDVVRGTRAAGVEVPIICMGYVNPLLAYGVERFCADAAAAGVDGLIVPDVPLESAGELRAACAANGLGITFLATPLTSDERIAELAAASTGFLYAVASTGTTGARSDVAAATIELLDRARAVAVEVPVAVGFGVSTAEHVAALAPHADGVIVGSALVARVEREAASVAAEVASLRAATSRA
jgi:tryptophan synthase alpha subunit